MQYCRLWGVLEPARFTRCVAIDRRHLWGYRGGSCARSESIGSRIGLGHVFCLTSPSISQGNHWTGVHCVLELKSFIAELVAECRQHAGGTGHGVDG
jgi:hypothetical protein